MGRAAVGCGLLVLAACAHPVVIERREVAFEAGTPVLFRGEAPLRWTFGDASAPSEGETATHVYTRPGRYVVQGTRGEALWRQVELIVVPRSPVHATPPDVAWVLIAREQKALGSMADALARVLGPAEVDRQLENAPAWRFVLEGAADEVRDELEGGALFTWPEFPEARVSMIGVSDEEAARARFKAWLSNNQWAFVSSVLGLDRYERENQALDVFTDRGSLFAVLTGLTQRVRSAQQRIAAASAMGLEHDGATASALDRLPSGALVAWARAPSGLGWSSLSGTMRFRGSDEVQLEARVSGPSALWSVPQVGGPRLLGKAPAGPVAAAAATIELRQLATLLIGTEGSPRRRQLEDELALRSVSLDRALAALSGTLDAAVYADVEGFVRGTIAAGGRPQPQGTVLLELAVSDAEALDPAVDALLDRWGVHFSKARDQDTRLWRGTWAGRPVQVVLTPTGLFVSAGSSVSGRPPVDLTRSLSERFEGAFEPGHVSLLVDVAQLRRELLEPRRLIGLDPRQSIAAQAVAVTVIDQLTGLELALADFVPTPEGATVNVVLKLRPRSVEDDER